MPSTLELAQAKIRAMRAAGIAPERLSPAERAQRNPTSLRRAVTAKCYECLGGADAKNIRKEIRDCTAVRCPLYPARPYQPS